MGNHSKYDTNIAFAQKTAEVIKEVEPDSDVYLFGSRARGDNRIDSDFDFFVLLDGELNYKRKEQLLSHLYEYQLSNLTFFDVIIKNKNAVSDNTVFSSSPLYQNIKNDMIEL